MKLLQLIYKKLNDIKQYENNPRKNDDAVKYVAESIKEFGFKVPIVIDKEVGGGNTCPTSEVKQRMIELLKNYNSKTNITINDIIEFHYEFEKIHPFQDGNGRVGRLIMLKECLKHNIVPMIINEELKLFYYRGLKEYKYDKRYLVDTCLCGQDIVKKYLDYFKIPYNE